MAILDEPILGTFGDRDINPDLVIGRDGTLVGPIAIVSDSPLVFGGFAQDFERWVTENAYSADR